jgi:uncharacterized protein (TIGR03083 family)
MFTQLDEVVAWRQIKRERQRLSDYLFGLTEDQWNLASSCEDWLVRDVVAHLIVEYKYSVKQDWLEFVKCGCNINRFMKQTAVQVGQTPTAELLSRFQLMINQQVKPASLSVLNILSDLLIHEQDIWLPLNHVKTMPTDSLRLLFTHWEPTKFNLGERITGIAARVKGLEFFIEDLDMIKGNGSAVMGQAEDIIMTVAGRKSSLQQLRGNGAVILRQRLK